MRFSRDQQNSPGVLKRLVFRNPVFFLFVSGIALLMMGYASFFASKPNQELSETHGMMPLRQEKNVVPKDQNLRIQNSGHKKSSQSRNNDSRWAAEVKEEERRRNILLTKPHQWHTFRYWDLHAYFSCVLEFGNGRPIYNSTQWARLRDYYNHFARSESKEEGVVKDGQLKRTFKFSDEIFDPPVEGTRI